MCKRITRFLFLSLCCFAINANTYAQEFIRNAELGHVKKNVLQLNNPRGIALNTTLGRIYVADQSNQRIVILNQSDGSVISTFGTPGSGAGQFNNPIGVAIAGDGSVYVLDQTNSRVQKFTSDGVFQSQFGAFGTGNGQFSTARGIAVNPSTGDIYVTDNHRLQRFNSSGVYQNHVGGSTAGATVSTHFNQPGGIAIDATGNVFVADAGNNRIQKFTSALAPGTPASFGTLGSADGQLNSPNSVFSNGTNVYVADTGNSRVQLFSNTGTYLNKFGTFGTGNSQFSSLRALVVDGSNVIHTIEEGTDRIQKFGLTFSHMGTYGASTASGLFNEPRDMVFDSNGNLFIVDQENDRIQKYNSNGVFVSQWGTEGSADGQFFSPAGIGVDAGNNVFVADAGNHRVQKFDNNGVFLSKFGTSGSANGQFNLPQDVAFDASGNIYVVESGNRVQKFTAAAAYVTQWGSGGNGAGQFNIPRSVIVDSNGDVLVVDTNNNRVQKFSNTGTHIATFGSSGSGNGQLSGPSGIAIDSDNNIFIVEQSNNRFQKFSSTGTYLTKHGSSGIGAGQFLLPQGIAVKGNKIAVSDRFGRIQFFYALASEPAEQPGTLTFSDFTGSSFKGTIPAAVGNPAGYLVIRRTGSAPSGLPSDAEAYAAGATIGDGRVIYNGPAGAFLQNGLASNTTYHYKVFSYNGADSTTNYRLAFPLTASQTTINSPLSITKDLNETYTEMGSNPGSLSDLNGMVLFGADDGTSGTELWKSDGTSANTVMVKDVNPGSISGSSARLGVVNSKAIFVGNDGVTGSEIWVTDGTEAGTALLKDIYPGLGSSISGATGVTFNGFIYFVANDQVHGNELWRTDGTVAGTTMVKDIEPGAESGFPATGFNAAVMNNNMYFYASTLATGWELWKTDGTDAGTVMVKDINPLGANSANSGNFIVASSTLVFFAADNGTNGIEMWKSDGTEGGTQMIKDILNPGNGGTSVMKVVNNTLYFFTASVASPSTPARLWKSDGTDPGTTVVKDFLQIPTSGLNLVEMNNVLYFVASGNAVPFTGLELFKSDGTLAGTVVVKDIVAGNTAGASQSPLFVHNNTIYFTSSSSVATGVELWKSDGTEAGTTAVGDIYPGSTGSFPNSFVGIGTTVYFSAEGTQGRELYKTDGATITLVKNINSQVATADSWVGLPPTPVNNTLVFAAQSTGAAGDELWKSDGTETGTVKIDPGVNFTSIFNFMRKVGNTLYFAGNEPAAGVELWKTDGTNAGTVRVKDINPGTPGGLTGTLMLQHAEVNGTFFFVANDGTSGTELWKTDGTEAGTVRVKDINPGSGSSNPGMMANVGGVLYFLATDGTGVQLWKSDGTSINTVAVTSIPGGFSTYSNTARHNAVVNGIFYFVVNEVSGGNSLWKSNGTAGGTEKITTMNSISQVIPLSNKLVFTKTNGIQMWTTDGTISGTSKIADFSSIGVSSSIEPIIINDTYYFLAGKIATGIELWKTDGTTNGTTLFKEFLPGPSGGVGSLYPALDHGKFYFIALETPGHVNMWESDGTLCKTYRLTSDIVSNVSATRLGQRLFFIDVNDYTGGELFTFELTQIAAPELTQITTQPSPQTACAGSPVTLQVSATGSALTYQWKKAGTTIPGAVNATFAMPSPAATDAGSYTVDVTGTCGTVISSAVTVTINTPTSISTPPVATTVCAGQALNLNVSAQGSSLTYQWKKDNADISGATTATYSKSSSVAADAGSYTVLVTGACGNQTPAAVTVTINAVTAITGQPAKTLKRVNENFTLTTTAAGAGLTYQWKKNDVDIAGATLASYSKTSAQTGDSGDYKVVVTGSCGSATSNVARVDIIDPVKTNLTIPFNSFGGDQNNYRIVSVPLNLTNMTVQDVFVDDLNQYDNTNWRLFRYEGGSTTELNATSNIGIGKGYWLIVLSQAQMDTGPGEISMADPHIITLNPGWNQIGNPFPTDISWSDVVAANPGNTVNLRVFEGGWANGTVLKAFGGGFINVTQTMQLNIPRGTFVGGRQKGETPKQPLDSDEWEVVLNVKHGNTYYNLGGVGMSPGADDMAFDGLDEYNLPRFMDYVEVVHPFSHHGFAASKSIVATRDENIWDFIVGTNQDEKTAQIEWDNSYFGENDLNLHLVDLENDMAVDMRQANVYNFQVRGHQHRFRIIYGRQDFVARNSVPERENLQVHPNPFTKEVSIRYAVPQPSSVEVDVLDNQAHHLKTLVSGPQAAGHHTVLLGADSESWANGMYIVRVKIGARTFYSKIIKH